MVTALRLASSQNPSMNTLMHRAVKLLQLSSLDFKMEVERIATANPFLDLRSADPLTTSPAIGGDTHADPIPASEARGTLETPESSPVADPSPTEVGPAPFDDSFSGPVRSYQESSDTAWDMSASMCATTDVRAHLLAQVEDIGLTGRDRDVVHCVIHSLDDDGYLRESPEALAGSLPLAWAVTPGEIAIALAKVQGLEPCGVGARSLSEYLSLQLLRRFPPSESRALALRICESHLTTLAQHEHGRLARDLNAPKALLACALSLIFRLSPRIDVDHRVSPDQFVIPDVTVKALHGGLSLDMNRSVIPQVRLNNDYIAEVVRAKIRRSDRINVCVSEARWMVRLIDQRMKTIMDVAAAIARRQHAFFVLGDMALKPMTLRHIADDLGIHESTVCRVTNGKYMSTPQGLLEFKQFFSRQVVTDSGRTCSAGAIRGLVRTILEDAQRPISDGEIAIQLATQGIRISRRTVTKYRNALGINALALQKVQRRRAGAD